MSLKELEELLLQWNTCILDIINRGEKLIMAELKNTVINGDLEIIGNLIYGGES